MLARFELDESEGFRSLVDRTPRVIVLMRGRGCPYSATFEPVFAQVDAPPGWERALRVVEEAGRGPVATALGVDITPTVVAFVDGKETARLPAKLLLGIPRTSYARWLKALRQ